MKGQKGNMYDFAVAWNALHGECSHKCVYCSTKTLKRFPVMQKCYSGEPRLNHVAMKENLYKGKYKDKLIFVCGQNDLFTTKVHEDIIVEILNYCNNFPKAKFLFQTKNTEMLKYYSYLLPKNSIICTTIETNRDYKLSVAPSINDRLNWFNQIERYEKHITIEPICDFDLDIFSNMLISAKPVQINIGADSKKHNLPEPSKKKILQLIYILEKANIKVHKKSNLKRLLQ